MLQTATVKTLLDVRLLQLTQTTTPIFLVSQLLAVQQQLRLRLVVQQQVTATSYQMVANLLLSYVLLVSVLTTFSQLTVQVTLKKFVAT